MLGVCGPWLFDIYFGVLMFWMFGKSRKLYGGSQDTYLSTGLEAPKMYSSHEQRPRDLLTYGCQLGGVKLDGRVASLPFWDAAHTSSRTPPWLKQGVVRVSLVRYDCIVSMRVMACLKSEGETRKLQACQQPFAYFVFKCLG
jgi:hypothetical protein